MYVGFGGSFVIQLDGLIARSDWVLLSTTMAQEVHNPFSNRQALIGGNFKQLYVGPQT